ncbi:endo alpha-1,4 polygalactosaminidase [Actinoplanes sp. NPDC049265]|uniref:endo alpha-1,4 polygalactosaminidase n=1 Tax=Actinoplanes sp. NPDC049265 TaxID=3363902 RepID=UPI00371334C0
MAIASRRILALALGAAVVTGIGITAMNADAGVSRVAAVTPPPVNAKFDYQIGGAYTPPSGVQVVSRDREASPAAGIYNICYVNAFQTQPIQSEIDMWRSKGLTLKNSRGQEVVDGQWDEILLDITTDAKRQAVAAVVNGWIDGCASKGYKAIEPDNLDSFSRSQNLIDEQDAIAYISLLISHAHGKGLAIAQKNTIGDIGDGGIGAAGKNAGLDFAVAEECGQYTECGDYQSLYGNKVIVIEYTTGGFNKACSTVGAQVSVVRRDTAVSPNGPYQAC